MIILGTSKLSGCVPIPSTAKARNLVARIPENACMPAALCLLNEDAAAVVYIKTVPLGQGGRVSATDHGIRLQPGQSFDWMGSPPRGVDVIAVSTVDNSLLAVEGNWCVTEDDV